MNILNADEYIKKIIPTENEFGKQDTCSIKRYSTCQRS